MNKGEGLRVLIVGAGLVAFGCAHSAIQDSHEVFVVDHSIEFGLPNVWPSVLFNRESIPLAFSTDQQFEGTDSAFRHEWIMKGMSIELAKQGTLFSHRTRVVSTSKNSEGCYNVELVGAGQLNGKLTFDVLIDTTQDTWIPWASPHNIGDSTNRYSVERENATGFVHLQSQSSEFSDAIYQINRQDGLWESWYTGIHESNNLKVIEIIATMLPVNHALWDCTERFQTGTAIWNEVKS